MKKKQSTQFLKKKNNLFFIVTFLVLVNCLLAYSQIPNPFLKDSRQKENIYSEDKRSVLIVFDASGSMEEKIHGETKIHIAKRVLKDVLEKADQDVNIGLRVYGATKPTGDPSIDCNDSRLLVVPKINNRRTIINEIYNILPRGFTPITISLSHAVNDLVPYRGEKSIILISDGIETCGGDPCLLSQSLATNNIDLKIDVVGFGIRDDFEAQQQLMCIALNTHGRFFSAESAQELSQSLSESINKTVTGRLILMGGKEFEVKTEETEGYEKLPKLQAEKLNLKKKK